MYKVFCLIIIDVVFILGMEDEIGLIVFGKKVDFVVFERDLYCVGVGELRNIDVWGVVFEGEVYWVE